MTTPKAQQLAFTMIVDTSRRIGLTIAEEKLIAHAIACLEARYLVKKEAITSPQETRAYFKLKLDSLKAEIFACLYLDNRHQVLGYEELFQGTIDGTSIHPREVVRRVIEMGAAAVIFAHNHPSGMTEPSQADLRITQRLKEALALIEVRVLDHLIIGEGDGVSLAERGLL
jgi:DNA repair protein RadC